MKRDQLLQAIARDSRPREDIVETALQSFQVAADVGDRVEEEAVPSARLQRETSTYEEDRQANHQQRR